MSQSAQTENEKLGITTTTPRKRLTSHLHKETIFQEVLLRTFHLDPLTDIYENNKKWLAFLCKTLDFCKTLDSAKQHIKDKSKAK